MGNDLIFTAIAQLWAFMHCYAAQTDEGQAFEYFKEILIYTPTLILELRA